MGTPYWQPRHIREELADKSNPRARGGKKPNSIAGKKILWDRYLQMRKELWELVVRADKEVKFRVDEEFRWRAAGLSKKHVSIRSLFDVWGGGCIEDMFKKIPRMEKEMETRGL